MQCAGDCTQQSKTTDSKVKEISITRLRKKRRVPPFDRDANIIMFFHCDRIIGKQLYRPTVYYNKSRTYILHLYVIVFFSSSFVEFARPETKLYSNVADSPPPPHHRCLHPYTSGESWCTVRGLGVRGPTHRVETGTPRNLFSTRRTLMLAPGLPPTSSHHPLGTLPTSDRITYTAADPPAISYSSATFSAAQAGRT